MSIKKTKAKKDNILTKGNSESGSKENLTYRQENQRRKNRVLLVLLLASVGLFYLLSILKYL